MPLLMDWLESLSYDIKAGGQCVRNASPFSTCTACQESCEKNAIIIDKSGIQILKNRCDGCGMCIPSCPVQALEGLSPIRKTIGDTLVLDEDLQPTKYELLHFHKKGIRAIAIPKGDKKMQKLVDETNETLEKMETNLFQVITGPVQDLRGQKRLSRREFFSKLAIDSKHLALSTITPAKWRFDQDKFRRAGMFEGWAFFQVHLDSVKCSLCEACFRLCPGEVFMTNGSLLVIDTGNCNGCSLCMDVCRENAVRLEPDLQKALELEATVLPLSCQKCSCDFLGWKQADICPICQGKGQHSLS
ncbi:4Fe-4S binding protein [Bacillus sp. FJAT-27251]|uniref:4Fe-4S binding protein n=1 Tax=Bacillus sp. FJAT-27251 TaxID=1684142 RepID=UPI0006A7EA68|nr:4Fe-4S binding protein [Bacillus sp. FJAT-27251]